tara:strand:- start:1859 stop:2152 length:294 start_codon:yes stop_codon:yes gene_type:complete
MKNYISSLDFNINLKKNISAIIYSFFIGVGISSIPFFYNLIESIRSERLVHIEKEIQIQKIKDQCRNKNSNYTRILNQGFPDSALEKFYICIEENGL